ncbi:MAG: hypothetical protein AAB512_04280 [Patescibacteria group bacterium]
MQKKLLPIILIILPLVFFVPVVFASSLQVSKSSGFSSSDTNFNAGEKVYTRTASDSSGNGKKVLNIRDNQYNLIRSVDLVQAGNNFSANFDAPSSEGYYSLEAVIEGEGASSKSVKTIKVGGPSGANIKVNVNSNVKGTSVSNVSDVPKVSKAESDNDKDVQANTVSPAPEVYSSQSSLTGEIKPAKSNWFFKFFTNIFSFFWPFK